ncbi:MAG: radical SAM protein [Candidatus Nanoarchaeia archaeon]|jgi:hypothetical protein
MREHYLIKDSDNIPLIGAHLFGIIDRGTNVLQIRSITGCPLKCIYCSVDEGEGSKKRNTYQVENNYLLKEINEIIKIKGIDDTEAHIDGVGEPLLNKDIVNLVKGLRKNKNIKIISMQTNGILLTEKLLDELENAGLDRINLSINSLNPETAKKLSGIPGYDINRIKLLAQNISKSKIKLLIAPVIVPGFNENIDDLIIFAKSINARLGIQKYEHYKHGRKLKAKEWSWYKFYNYLKELEKKHETKLILKKEEFGIHKTNSLPIVFRKNETVKGKVVLPGWLSNEAIISAKNRIITVFDCNAKINDLVKAKIVKTKHNLYLAKRA